MKTLSLAMRNLTRQKKRSILLGGAIAFGFFVVILIDALSAGAVVSLSNQFAQIFAGHILVDGYEKKGDKTTNIIRDNTVVLQAIDTLAAQGMKTLSVNERTAANGTIIFEGKKATTNIFGVNFDKETLLPNTFSLISGSWEDVAQPNALILGETIAKELNLQVGDSVLFDLTTVNGQKNIGDFTLVAINKEPGLIGSIAAYANKNYINELMELEPQELNMLSIMLPHQSTQDAYALAIEQIIAQSAPISSRADAVKSNPTEVQQTMYRQLKKTEWDGTKYFITSLNDQLTQFHQIAGVLQSVSTGILIVLFLVVMIGIANTFKMIVFERIREIGTMRAVGMMRRQVKTVFIWEAVLLAICGAIAGLVLAIVAMNILALFTFNSPELSIVLQNGHFAYILSAQGIIIKFILIIILTILAVQSSASQAAKLNPAEALRTTK